ncbi:unnamed protein product, partial [Closterium sp. NIES-53]
MVPSSSHGAHFPCSLFLLRTSHSVLCSCQSVQKPGIDEEAIRSADPHELVSLLSRAKADALLAKLKAEGRTFLETADVPTLLITADQ